MRLLSLILLSLLILPLLAQAGVGSAFRFSGAQKIPGPSLTSFEDSTWGLWTPTFTIAASGANGTTKSAYAAVSGSQTKSMSRSVTLTREGSVSFYYVMSGTGSYLFRYGPTPSSVSLVSTSNAWSAKQTVSLPAGTYNLEFLLSAASSTSYGYVDEIEIIY